MNKNDKINDVDEKHSSFFVDIINNTCYNVYIILQKGDYGF